MDGVVIWMMALYGWCCYMDGSIIWIWLWMVVIYMDGGVLWMLVLYG